MMLEHYNVNNEMQYQKLTAEEQQQRGILGRLVGIIADFKNATRNGRRYTEELWDKAFNNPIIREKFENRCLFGELGHPVDRQEVDMEKVCICLAEPPKKGNDGKLYGVFDILDTPNGRILKTFCDYGTRIGVSSRGSGDTFEDYNGDETVDPDSYECECWDAVLLPAVKSARPTYVTESYDPSKRTLKRALQEALENSSEDEKKIMIETLKDLEVDYTSDKEEDTSSVDTTTETDNISESVALEEAPMAAEDNGADELVQELQESLRAQQELEQQVKSLQEKLSVCYTKEARYSSVLQKTKDQLAQAQEQNKQLAEQLETCNAATAEASVTIVDQQQRIRMLQERLSTGKGQNQKLTESLTNKDSELRTLHSTIKSLKEEFNQKSSEKDKECARLTEALAESKKDSQIIRNQAAAKVTQAQQLTEKYKTIAKTAVDKYIRSQALRLGVSPDEIKNRLSESYSFNDIDHVCESLQKYKLTVNSLPFNVAKDTPVKMTIRESREVICPVNNDDRIDDEVDTTLSNFIR